MSGSVQPKPNEWRVTVWAEWVAGGADVEARRNRLDRVPVVIRDVVRQEVVWHFGRVKALAKYRSSPG